MPFDAIVHAPTLRQGARVNIAEADQVDGKVPMRLGVGAEVRLRFGVCCPDLARGRVVAFARQHPDVVVLAIGAETWTLRKGDVGVSTPGLVSESWYVAQSAIPGASQSASPPDHNVAQSSSSVIVEG